MSTASPSSSAMFPSISVVSASPDGREPTSSSSDASAASTVRTAASKTQLRKRALFSRINRGKFWSLMPKSRAATWAAKRLVFDEEEWVKTFRVPLALYYSRFLQNILDKTMLLYVPDWFLHTANIMVAPLDITTGTTGDATEPWTRSREPTFIRPWAASRMQQYIDECRERNRHGHGDDRLDSRFRVGPDESWLSQRTRDITKWRSRDRYLAVSDFLYGLSMWAEEANPAWKHAGYVPSGGDRNGKLYWRRVASLETVDWPAKPHRTAFLSSALAPPTDGSVNVVELDRILAMFVSRLYMEDTPLEKQPRHFPVTVVSGSGPFVRILHAWDDTHNPTELNIRVSPVMRFGDDKAVDEENWLKLACFVAGDPIFEEAPEKANQLV